MKTTDVVMEELVSVCQQDPDLNVEESNSMIPQHPFGMLKLLILVPNNEASRKITFYVAIF